MSDKGDGQLALAVRAGRPEAVERLVLTYQDGLYSYAVRLLRDPSEAREVTQDAFLSACRALTSRYSEEQCRRLALRPWLFRITRNLVYNRLRTARQRYDRPLPAPDGWHPPALRDDTPPERALEALEERQRLSGALACLTRASREMILLRFVEEMAYAEIATIMGMSEAAVRGRVFRALRQLRALLAAGEATDVV